MNKLVSILIPLYNSEKYIQETILSCINQTYKNIEIIILDDGSTDNSLKIVKNLQQQYSNLNVYSNENVGAQVTRNKLFEISKGDYIQYLDADDILDKNKINNQMELLKNEPETTICFCKWLGFKESRENIVMNEKLSIYNTYENNIDFLLDMWTNLEAISPHTWLVHRNIIKQSNGWNLNLKKNQDGEFFSRIICLSKKVIFSSNSTVFYRLDSEDSISKNTSYESSKSLLESIDCYQRTINKYSNNKRINYALARLYSNFIINNNPLYDDIYINTLDRIEKLGFNKIIFNKNNYILKLLFFIIGLKNYKKIFNFLRSLN